MKAIAILGPTASGKTALSLALAARFPAEIVICDSMQIYRGMDIGTAKPTMEERAACPHHLVDLVSPDEAFSASAYADAAMDALRGITERERLPILCGGTGLYLDAVRTLRHNSEAPPPDPALRASLLAESEEEGGREALYERLRTVDPTAAAATHPNNVRRVVRALEIYLTTGRTKTEIDGAAPASNPALTLLTFVLTFRDRAALYARIDARVDAMLTAGLVDEARRLRDASVFASNTTAAGAIGYKELLPYLDGVCTYEAAVDDLKRATRRYAKRQITYFRRMSDVVPLETDGTDMEAMADALVPTIRAFLACP